MFGRRSATVIPAIQNACNNVKTKIESAHRIWLKIILSALIPLMIGVFTIATTVLQHRLSSQQREQDKYDSLLLRTQSDRQADNLQKEKVLVTYLDDITKLLMLENKTNNFVHIRTKTLTSLRQLDSERKRYLLLFLYESELIYRYPEQSVSSVLHVNGADFNDISFEGTDASKCSFLRMHLHDVYLTNSTFINCYIDYSNFSRSIMYKTMFYKGLLIRSSFKFTLLDRSNFFNIKLSMMIFHGASLAESNFTGSVWSNNSADFTNANLTGAILSKEQLKNSTLYNCILPDRTWGPIQTKNLVVNGDLEQNCTSNEGHILIGWNISNDGDIRVFPNGNQSPTRCHFRVTSFNNSKNIAYIIQTINLENYTLLISTGNARYNASASFQCIGLQYATMIVRFIDSNGLRDAGIDKETEHGTHIQSLIFSDIVRPDTRSVQILITFFRSRNNINAPIEGNHCVCHNVKFLIMKNTSY